MYKKIIIIMILLLLCGCNNKTINNEVNNKSEIQIKVENIMNSMSIEEKIGQMLIIDDSSKTVDDNLKKIMNDIKPGGFIIFSKNIGTFESTKTFINDLKNIGEIPLIVATDQEGGSIQRLQSIKDKNILYIPSMKNIGKTNNEEISYNVGSVLAEQLRTLGINTTFAPVVDVISSSDNSSIGNRSFGSNPKIVSKMAINFAKGIESKNIIATYKHFPGHGATATNSHMDLPVINKTYEELYNSDLIPYVNAIKNDAKIIMIGHLSFPNITNDNTPSSLSKIIITDILKDKLNYKGLVITDALDMKALTNNYTNEQIITYAINAGVDLLLMPNDIYDVINIIKDNIPEERINESTYKILMFKYKYLNDYKLLDESYLNNEKQRQIIDSVISK